VESGNGAIIKKPRTFSLKPTQSQFSSLGMDSWLGVGATSQESSSLT